MYRLPTTATRGGPFVWKEFQAIRGIHYWFSYVRETPELLIENETFWQSALLLFFGFFSGCITKNKFAENIF
jgi:hypothetical protein